MAKAPPKPPSPFDKSLSDLSPWAGPAVQTMDERAALAALTPGIGDDIAAATTAISIWTSLLRLAKKRKAPGAITEAAQGLAGARTTLSDLSAAAGPADTSALLQQLNDNLKEQIQNQKALFNVSQSNYGALAQALTAVVSGQIGGKVGMGLQSPSFAGGLARY